MPKEEFEARVHKITLQKPGGRQSAASDKPPPPPPRTEQLNTFAANSTGKPAALDKPGGRSEAEIQALRQKKIEETTRQYDNALDKLFSGELTLMGLANGLNASTQNRLFVVDGGANVVVPLKFAGTPGYSSHFSFRLDVGKGTYPTPKQVGSWLLLYDTVGKQTKPSNCATLYASKPGKGNWLTDRTTQFTLASPGGTAAAASPQRHQQGQGGGGTGPKSKKQREREKKKAKRFAANQAKLEGGGADQDEAGAEDESGLGGWNTTFE